MRSECGGIISKGKNFIKNFYRKKRNGTSFVEYINVILCM